MFVIDKTHSEKVVQTQGELIKFPTPSRNGYSFVAWEPELKKVPYGDVIIKALWKMAETSTPRVTNTKLTPNTINAINARNTAISTFFNNIIDTILTTFNTTEDGTTNTKLITYIVASVATLLVACLSLYALISRIRTTAKSVVTRNNCVERISSYDESGKSIWNVINPLDVNELYPNGLPSQSLESALIAAGYTQCQVSQICSECADVADKAAPQMTLFDRISREDIMNIAMYTFDFSEGDPENNPYRRTNKALSEENVLEFRKIDWLFYILLTSLRKLTRVCGITLYRGTNRKMNLAEYKQGNRVTWARFSSASKNMGTVKDFLGTKKSWAKGFAGTIFIVENGWGYDISRFSVFPYEEEVLLEPMREFEVKSVLNQNGLVLISLKMLDTPTIMLEPNTQFPYNYGSVIV